MSFGRVEHGWGKPNAEIVSRTAIVSNPAPASSLRFYIERPNSHLDHADERATANTREHKIEAACTATERHPTSNRLDKFIGANLSETSSPPRLVANKMIDQSLPLNHDEQKNRGNVADNAKPRLPKLNRAE